MLRRLLRSAFKSRGSAAASVRRALQLRHDGRHAEAETLLREALREYPHDPAVATNLAVALLEHNRGAEAAGLLKRALDSDADFGAAHFNYAHVLRFNGRITDAIRHYHAATQAEPAIPEAHEALLQALLDACDWDGAATLADELRDRAAHEPADEWMRHVSPLTAGYLRLSPEQCKAVAAFHAPAPRQGALKSGAREPRAGRRLRVGYFSADFRNHAVGSVLREVFAHHDRSRFEMHAFSFGIDDGSVYRRAMEESVDRFWDVERWSDDDVAAAIAGARIDVLVDLMGHTTGNRLAVLARRPAPVQAHYLGYPGTTGASYVDYFISDEIATPTPHEAWFSESIVRVPECFFVSDGADALAAPPSSREQHGLPVGAYVFANFGASARIDRESFDLWMKILERAPRSILWLREPNALAMENLRSAARARGVDPQRLVFAASVPAKGSHLSRLGCADLALDTIGWYNGHSTTADLLWAGVPVLTLPGETFATRVAASLVRAAGLSELVVMTSDAYVDTAVALADDGDRGRALRERLRGARGSAPFFDTPNLVRGLEATYDAMYAAKMRPPTGL
jgi:protein O-GlcNAc transferase